MSASGNWTSVNGCHCIWCDPEPKRLGESKITLDDGVIVTTTVTEGTDGNDYDVNVDFTVPTPESKRLVL